MPGVEGIPLLGDVGFVGDVVPGDVVDGEEAPGVGVAVLGCGVAVLGLGVAVPGLGVAAPEFGVAVPGVVPLGLALAPCVCTVPSLAIHGVLLPGAVVPGRVLGGLLGVPGAF